MRYIFTSISSVRDYFLISYPGLGLLLRFTNQKPFLVCKWIIINPNFEKEKYHNVYRNNFSAKRENRISVVYIKSYAQDFNKIGAILQPFTDFLLK